MQYMIDIDAALGERLGPEFREVPPDEARARLRALLELALLRADEATLLGLLEGRASAKLDALAGTLRSLEAVLDRVLFYSVASYALARAPYDTGEARRIFRTSYEDARAEIERRLLGSSSAAETPRC